MFADQRRLGQILKDAYNGTVQQSQTEQLAHAVAQQNIKVHGASCPEKSLLMHLVAVSMALQEHKLYSMAFEQERMSTGADLAWSWRSAGPCFQQ